jgi:UDP:flavonoid glycosyltransferase YjiC (YdhE family)
MPALPFGGMPRWLNRLSWRLSDALAAATILSAVDEERGRRGLAPAGPASRHICGDEVLVPFPHTLGVVDDADVPVRQLGPWLLDDDEPLPAPVARFLDDGAPPVFFGLGSMPGAQELVGRFIEAARLAGVRALITGDGPTEGTVHCHPGPLPHARVFPRCAAVVHHGGAGTTTTELLAAVPQVLLPSVADQHHHGRLVHRAGLGPPPVPARRRQPSAIAAALRAALDTAPDRLSAAAAATRRDGLDEAVRVLEACAGAPSAA